MKIFKLITFLTLVAFGFLACTTTENCTEEKSVNMQIGFYTNTATSTDALSIDSIWVRGLGVDSFLYKKKTAVKSILVPLKDLDIHTDYIVRFNNITDTISVFYQSNNQYYLSLECGCVVSHTIDEVIFTKNFIKSVIITNRNINTLSTENVQIFNN